MREKLSSKWTSLYLFILFNLITMILFLTVNILTTFILKQSQSKQIYLENRNNVLLTDYRALQVSLGLRVNSDFNLITIKNEKDDIFHKMERSKIDNLYKNYPPLFYGTITYPIFYDENKQNIFGKITFTYQRITSFFYFFLVWFFLLILSIPVVIKLSKIINNKIKRDLEQHKLAAIGQTTSMLAHDVRKPFTMVKSIINIIDEIKDDPSALKHAKEDVGKAIKNVEAMIADIMDYSREVQLESAPHELSSLINNSIKQTVQGYPAADINFIYTFSNKYRPLVDEERIMRVFGNIIGNAIEAITVIGKMDSGSIYFSSQDRMEGSKRYIEIAIGNSGPAFKEEDIPCLFDSFFTKGKKKGTGLGLASVQKIVALHDGKIWAENLNEERGVQFVIRVPASSEKEKELVSKLPASIKQALPQEILKENVPTLNLGGETIKVLLLEDEALYRALVRNTVMKDESLRKSVVLYEAQKVEDALDLIRQEKIEFAIVDIDLGEVKNGFDFLAEAKKLFPNLKSIVHSNRCIKEDFKRAQQLGASQFVPKPLELSHLMCLLTAEKDNANTPKKDEATYDFVYIEDDYYFRKDWERFAKKAGAKLLTLANPEEFAKHESSLSMETCEIYIDRELGDEWPKGEEFAISLHQKGFKKLFLATGHDAQMFKHLEWLKCTGKASPWDAQEDF